MKAYWMIEAKTTAQWLTIDKDGELTWADSWAALRFENKESAEMVLDIFRAMKIKDTWNELSDARITDHIDV